jgi:hypothetical protein
MSLNLNHPFMDAPQVPITRAVELPPSIMDIEASGFGPGSYPIEIGFVGSDGKAWCSLIRPESDWQHWDEKAARMHGITRAQMKQNGRSVGEIAEALNSQLRGQIIYSDAWAHDYTWLNRIYESAERSPSFKLENLRALLDEQQAAHWHEVKAQLQISLGTQRHRASADARLLQQTFMAVQAWRQPAPTDLS